MKSSRRTFLKTSVAASSLFAVPMIIPARAFGANERVVTGHIGVGGQGKANLNAFLGTKQVSPAFVCDVDSERSAQAADIVTKAGQKAEIVGDYRKILDRKDVDAVVISTPDHWHAPITIAACQAGKDVYCEKPLTLSIAEGRLMVNAAREHKRMVQTGSQQRSGKEFRQACELVRNGAIGKVHTVLVGIPKPNHPGMPIPDSDPPSNLDYNRWLGPAPQRPYNKNRVHYNFRFFRDYSGGQMTNFGAHHLDIAQWGLGVDGLGPVSTEGTGTFHPEKWHEVTETCRVTHTYADGAKVILGQQQKDIPDGCTFLGEKGKIYVTRGKITSDPAEILQTPTDSFKIRLEVSNNHHVNFLDSLKSRTLPICDVEIGHRSATICHLGNIAIQLGRKLNWDPVKEQFVGDDEASAMVSRPYRAGYDA
ncbi:MAG: Gfo/Idh/MocA family protein [Planctomycetaceae bacterium]